MTTEAHAPPPPLSEDEFLSGHIEACPKYIRETDVNRYNGFLGQYGEFCYELVNTPTQWTNADRHCQIVSTGHLVQVLIQDEQDFLVRFLNKHHFVNSVWLGLTDSGTNSEGQWRWVSGMQGVSYDISKYNTIETNISIISYSDTVS